MAGVLPKDCQKKYPKALDTIDERQYQFFKGFFYFIPDAGYNPPIMIFNSCALMHITGILY